MAADSEQLRLWRAQLAEEESDEEDLSALSQPAGRMPPPRRATGPSAAVNGATRGGGAPSGGTDQVGDYQLKNTYARTAFPAQHASPHAGLAVPLASPRM